MQAYKTQQVVKIASGTVLALSDAQAIARNHALECLDDGIYKAKIDLQFKAGEVIGLDAVPPSLVAALRPVEPVGDDSAWLSRLSVVRDLLFGEGDTEPNGESKPEGDTKPNGESKPEGEAESNDEPSLKKTNRKK